MKLVIILCTLIITLPVHANEVPNRIISIGGALTEIIYELGAGEKLVGSDTTSYFPEAAEQLPKVGYQRALSAEGILSLNPDLIIVTEDAGPDNVLAQVENAGTKLMRLKAGRSLEDVIENINAIARMLHLEQQGAGLIDNINQQREKLAEQLTDQKQKPKVLFILSHTGGAPMAAGTDTAADSIITLSGADNVVSDYQGYKPLTAEAALLQSPEIILTTTQGLEQAGGMDDFLKKPGLALTPAGKKGRVIAMDSLLLLGFGPRTIEAARQLYTTYQQ